MKKPLNERMEEARLEELMPGFDKDAEWARLSGKLHPGKKRVLMPTWLRAAAAVLLLVAGGSVTWYLTQNNNSAEAAITQADNDTRNEWSNFTLPPAPSDNTAEQQTTASTQEVTQNGAEESTAAATTTHRSTNEPLHNNKRTGEFVCNGTPCPIEICIIQTIKCKNERPSAISTCSIIEPDQAHQLHYKAAEGAGPQCKVTVAEIRIRRINTGETIVLNAHSEPSTAQELFNCLTGEVTCNLLAGVFNNDCNNEPKKHNLKIGNEHGSLTVQ